MADYYEAYHKTMINEGGYANDPDDVGGETYKGISRRYNPSWEGWYTIDNYKNDQNFPDVLDADSGLQTQVKLFYKKMYWDVNLLDEIEDQELGERLFDIGVNMGISRAAKFLQSALNYLNKNEDLFYDLIIDGKVGNITLNAIDNILERGEVNYLLKIIILLQGNHYLNYMSSSPTQEKYARGWLNRLDITVN